MNPCELPHQTPGKVSKILFKKKAQHVMWITLKEESGSKQGGEVRLCEPQLNMEAGVNLLS